MYRAVANGNTRLPDFLLVGAAKSATSSLYFYLGQHPQIKVASKKESWFFSFYRKPPHYKSPGVLSDVVSELDEYLKLYDGAADDQLLGDACPSYLYTYEDTINSIRELYSDEALAKLKIIISLREPASRAYSQYYTFKRMVEEPLDFEQAVRPETIEQRMSQQWNIFYDYLGFGMYSKQVEAFQQAFGKDRVLVLLFEDINADIEQTCRRIFRFLGVDPEVVIDTQRKYNSLSGEPKMKWLVAGLVSQNRWKRRIAALIPHKLRKRIVFLVLKKLLRREAMDNRIRRRLSSYFDADIARLERLIDRDLSSWRS